MLTEKITTHSEKTFRIEARSFLFIFTLYQFPLPISMQQKNHISMALLYARSTGLEPATSSVHLSNIFIKAWTISSPCSDQCRRVGALVSSLYGAPDLTSGFPRYSHVRQLANLAFTDIPKSFNPPFRRKAAVIYREAL